MSLIVKAADQGINGLGMAASTVGVKQGGGKGKSIFAGTLLVPSETDNLVEQKRKEAQKQAKKIVGDAWQKDQKALQKIDEKWKLWNDKFTQIKDSEGRIADIEEAKKRLQQEYNVDPESQEQKDLEILERFQNYLKGLGDPKFTEEERKRLEELQYMERTEYQTEALKLNSDAADEKKSIEKLGLEREKLKGTIASEQLEHDISQDMLDASDLAKELLDASGKDIVNLLIQEGKDKIDEESEEEQEQAEEIKENKQEQQEQIDKIKENTKENREDQEEIIQGEIESDKMDHEVSYKQLGTVHMEQAQKNVQKLMADKKLIVEDLKGIEIDFGF